MQLPYNSYVVMTSLVCLIYFMMNFINCGVFYPMNNVLFYSALITLLLHNFVDDMKPEINH